MEKLLLKDFKKNNSGKLWFLSSRHDFKYDKVIFLQLLSTVTGKRVPIKSFCLAGSGEEKLVFSIVLKIK